MDNADTFKQWVNFLSNEKLTPNRVGDNLDRLMTLCEKLAMIASPKRKPYGYRLESRRLVCSTAMDMGFDLTAIRFHRGHAMGRGMLDSWNAEYVRRFGSNFGTAGWKEERRRDIKTVLSERNLK